MQVQPEKGKYVAIGLTSFGTACGKVGQYGVYTKVDYFLDWIINNVGFANLTCQHINIT